MIQMRVVSVILGQNTENKGAEMLLNGFAQKVLLKLGHGYAVGCEAGLALPEAVVICLRAAPFNFLMGNLKAQNTGGARP
jgi:hypothetical protein